MFKRALTQRADLSNSVVIFNRSRRAEEQCPKDENGNAILECALAQVGFHACLKSRSAMG